MVKQMEELASSDIYELDPYIASYVQLNNQFSPFAALLLQFSEYK